MTGSRAPGSRGADAARRLLVTAFGRFEDGPNCSEALLAALRRDRPALEAAWSGAVFLRVLPVDAVAIEAALAGALGRAAPSHVLLTGQAAGRDALSLERIARNVRDLGVPDDAGRLGDLGPVREGGPAERRATWPDLPGAAAAMTAAGAAARTSDDAGSHLCNQTLYLALEAAERAATPFVATFLHLPLTADQVAAGIPAALSRPGCPSVPLADMTRAVVAFLGHTRRAIA